MKDRRSPEPVAEHRVQLRTRPFAFRRGHQPEDCPSERVKPLQTEVKVANVIGRKLRLIPRGEFWMGSPMTEVDRGIDETQHQVRLTKSYF